MLSLLLSRRLLLLPRSELPSSQVVLLLLLVPVKVPLAVVLK
jgi:hypothetical protein